jgi:hypothetical protein
MSTTVYQALELAAIGLPAMFFVIFLFVLLGQLLLKIFPEKEADKLDK